MNSRGPKVRQAEPLQPLPDALTHEPAATSAALSTVPAGHAEHDPHGLDPHAGRAQFALLAMIGLAMFLGFGFLSFTGASAHPQGNYFLAALSLLGLSMSWFYGSSIRARPKGVTLNSAPHIPTRAVLPARSLDVQPTVRKGLRFVLAFFSIATAMFAHLTFWVALRSPNAGTVGAYVGAVFISIFGVFTGVGAVAIARELRAKPRFGAPDRVERWCRVHEIRDGFGSALEPASRVYVLDHPRGGAHPLELTIAGYERAPWLVAGHALAVFSPATPEDIQLVRDDGSPFAITDDELRAINGAIEEPRNYRS